MRLFPTSLLAMAFFVSMIVSPVAAPSQEILDDPVLEERAQEISKGLRCVVCKNQSINESSASLARDMRLLVREKLEDGYTDDQVVEYIVGSYGEFVLLKPRYSAQNAFLWISPLLVLIGGGFLAVMFLRNQKEPVAPVAALSDEEQQELDQLMNAQAEDVGEDASSPTPSPTQSPAPSPTKSA